MHPCVLERSRKREHIDGPRENIVLWYNVRNPGERSPPAVYHRCVATDHFMLVLRPVTEQPERFCTVRTSYRTACALLHRYFTPRWDNANRENTT